MLAVPVSAHHAVQALYDLEKPTEWKGVLGKVEWINPHSYLYLDIKDEAGNVRRWGFETDAPAVLRRAGFTRGSSSFKVGDTYTITGYPARNGSETALVSAIEFSDGRKVTLARQDRQ
jgi:hypothetical protein